MHLLSMIVLSATLLSVVMCDVTDVLADGTSPEEKAPSPEVNKAVEVLKKEIIAEIYKNCMAAGKDSKSTCSESLDIHPVSYKSQVFSGVNYFIKAKAKNTKTNERSYWHLRIWVQPWTNTRELISIKGPEEETNPIEYF